MEKWGKKLKVGKMRPFVNLASTDERHLCFFFACHGPLYLMNRFATVSQDTFEVIIENWVDPVLTSEPYDILIDGFIFTDTSYKL